MRFCHIFVWLNIVIDITRLVFNEICPQCFRRCSNAEIYIKCVRLEILRVMYFMFTLYYMLQSMWVLITFSSTHTLREVIITASDDLDHYTTDATDNIIQYYNNTISSGCVTQNRTPWSTIVYINPTRVGIKLHCDALVFSQKMSYFSVQNCVSFLLISRIYWNYLVQGSNPENSGS